MGKKSSQLDASNLWHCWNLDQNIYMKGFAHVAGTQCE